MWYVKSKKKPDWKPALRHLRGVDPVLARLIKRVGPCTITPRKDYFNLLCVAIFNQQISMKIAAILYDRFRNLFPRRKPTPKLVLRLLRDEMHRAKNCGISRQKRKYLIDLSEHFIDRKIPVRKLWLMSDEEVSASLTAVNGIGRWTAEMFLMFALNRPDVLPVDDLGLREGIKRAYKLKERPTAKEMTELAEIWRPWRTVATWYIWRGTE